MEKQNKFGITKAGKIVFTLLTSAIICTVAIITYGTSQTNKPHTVSSTEYDLLKTENNNLIDKYTTQEKKISDLKQEFLQNNKQFATQIFDHKYISLTSSPISGSSGEVVEFVNRTTDMPYPYDDGDSDSDYTTNCLTTSEDKGITYTLSFDASGEYSLKKEYDEKTFDIDKNIITKKDRTLGKNLISKEYNLTCKDGTKLGFRRIFNAKKFLGYFIYEGKDTDEYLLSKDGRYLWGSGAKFHTQFDQWLILDTKTQKFYDINADSCLDGDIKFSSDGENVSFSNYKQKSLYQTENIAYESSSCTFKVNGQYISGTVLAIEYNVEKLEEDLKTQNEKL